MVVTPKNGVNEFYPHDSWTLTSKPVQLKLGWRKTKTRKLYGI